MTLAVGIVLATLATLSTNFGNNIQKWAFNNVILDQYYYKNKYWLSGLLLSIAGSICDLFALANAAQSIVGPLASIGLISNLVFSHYWLKENITRKDINSTILIIIGITIILVFGNHSTKTYDIQDFISYSSKPSSILYILTILAISLYLIRHVNLIINIRERLNTQDCSETTQLDEYVVGRRLSLLRTYNEYKRNFPKYLAILSGILGGNSILFAKICSELISTAISTKDPSQIFSIFGFISIILLIFCIVYQQRYLAKGLEYFDVSIIIPIFQCAFILTTILSGGCYFMEFAKLNELSIIMFVCGTIIILYGIEQLSHSVEDEPISNLELTQIESDYTVLGIIEEED